MTPVPLRGKLAAAGPTGAGCFPGATVTATAGLAAPGGGHSRGRPRPSPAAAPLWSLAPIAAPTPAAVAGAAAAAASSVTAVAVKATVSSCLMKQQQQQGRMVATGAWRAGAPAGGGGGGQYDGGWDGRRAVGAAAATAAAAAALDGGSGVGPDGGGGDAAGFLELPTAEVRMSMVSERAASTCALGPEVAERMQADCIRPVRSWCKLGYGDHVVVHVEHQQLATPAGTPPGLLTSAAVTFAAPDGRRHAAVAVSVGVLCGAAASSPPPKTPSLPPSPSRASVNNQFGGAGGGDGDGGGGSRRRTTAAAHVAPGSSAPSLDPLPGLSLHWGCSYGPGQRWHTAASGWHTLPAVSYDAGKGAWQTPLAVRQAIPLDLDSDSDLEGVGGSGPGGPMVAVYSLVMQLPWEGPIRNGGVCFVLKTARNQWLKARVLPAAAGGGGGNPASGGGGGNPASGGGGGAASSGGGGGGGEADYWIPTASLPLVANGVALLPDVFRMSHSDSLPQVVATTLPSTPALEPPPPAAPPPPSPLGATAAAPAAATAANNGNGHTNSNGNGNGAAAATTTTTAAAQPTPQPLPQPQQQQQPLQGPSQQQQQGREQRQSREQRPQQHHQPQPQQRESADGTDLLGAAALFRPPPRLTDALLRPAERHPLPVVAPGERAADPCGWMLDHIEKREPSAERSLMHRYNAGAELVEMAAGSSDVAEALAAVTTWLRFSASRLLVWNRNYNIKPREISTAQSRLAAALAAALAAVGAARGPAAPGGRNGGGAAVAALVRVALAAVGRGGAGEVGQRIRDEILAVQQRNGCKGGMMEEWHQKLHNNTSPDDVVICQALLDYIAAGLDVTVYWRTLSSAGITAQRLASFDRAITSEPRFSGQQAAGLQRDLTAYLQTLQAVHGGDDLASAINNVLGYEETDMKGRGRCA